MKKSLIIRWSVVAVVVLAWTWAMFPLRDKDYLAEFEKMAAPKVATLRKQSKQLLELGNPEEIKGQLDAMSDKESAEYKTLKEKYDQLVASPNYAAWKQSRDYDELMRRIDKEREADRITSGYKILERAAQGDSDNYRIALSNFVKVPLQKKASNKTILSYIRVKSAGKLRLGLDLQGGTEFVVGFDPAEIPKGDRVEDIRDRILVILDNRLNVLGVTEPEIKATGPNRISVRMPSVDEADKADIRQTIKQAARLQFHLVAVNNAELVAQYEADPQGFKTPPGLLRKEIENEHSGDVFTEVIFIEKTPERIRGEDVDKAFPNVNEFGNWTISLKFKHRGALAFAEVTGKNVNRRLAIMLDDTIYSAPNIREAITGGQAEISGSFTYEEARRLAGVIASGNVPVSVQIDSEFGTDPTLGADAVRSGIMAGVLGLALVIIFMVWYYHLCGVITVVVLLTNGVLVLGTMALTKATITLPGIAGMVLSIGMAVDANVLIFERIREEMNRGKVLANSIKAGYTRAFSSIFDSNLTTLVTGYFMYQFGSGSVKGFAVTLCFGIFASMFTAIYMTRVIFDTMLLKGWIKKLTMRTFTKLQDLHIDYLKISKPAIYASTALVVISLLSFVIGMKRGTLMGIDFAGGSELSYICEGQTPDVDAVRDFLKGQGYSDNVRIGYKRGQGGDKLLEIVLPIDKSATIGGAEVDYTVFSQTLDQAFPEVKITLTQTNTVGGNVGAKFRNDAILAGLFSMIGIIIYLAFRFELRYGLAAVVAVVHDAITSAGLFVLCGGEMSLTVMAALMTIFGYSLNDTIVTFDRIRENRTLHRELNYYDTINLSINQTMSRTLLTSLTTMLGVLSLLIFGGGAIFDFALVMFFGMITGTYSTIFIANSFINTWDNYATKRQAKTKSGGRLATAKATK